MASVGGVSCDFVHGGVAGTRKRLRVWQAAGLDGFGAQDLGDGSPEFMVRCVKFDSNTNVNTWCAQIEALAGKVISILDDWGDTYPGCLVVGVGIRQKQAAQASGGVECRGEIALSARRAST